MKPENKSVWSNFRRWVPGLLISIVAIIALFQLANIEDLSLAFSRVQPFYLIAAISLTFLSLWTRAMAWRMLLDNKPGIKRTFFTVNIGYLLNNLFPLRAGEIGRALIMGKATGISPLHVLSTIVIERAFDMAIAAGLLLSTLPHVLGYDWAGPAAWITLGAVTGVLFVLYLMARFHEQVNAFVSKISERWGFIRRFILPKLDNLLKGLSALTNPRQFLISLFWIIVCWVLYLTTYYILLISVVPGAPLLWALFSNSVGALGVAVPSAPGGLGVLEAAIVGSLAVLKVSYADALAFALMVHFVSYLVTCVLGFWGLAREGQSLSMLLEEVSHRNPQTPDQPI